MKYTAGTSTSVAHAIGQHWTTSPYMVAILSRGTNSKYVRAIGASVARARDPRLLISPLQRLVVDFQ